MGTVHRQTISTKLKYKLTKLEIKIKQNGNEIDTHAASAAASADGTVFVIVAKVFSREAAAQAAVPAAAFLSI